MAKRSTKIDATETINEYIGKADWRINANANTSYSHASLINNTAGKVIANYWLDEVYSKEEGDAHRNGDYHIHDLDCLSPYCCGHDFQKLLDEGFNGVNGRVGSRPPKHFREALYQLANYFGILQSEWAGAQAVSSFDTYLAPYVFFDMQCCGESEDDIKKAMRNFIYNVNVPSRWGQASFTNVTIDWTVPQLMKDLTPTRGGENYFLSIFRDRREKINEAKANGDTNKAEMYDTQRGYIITKIMGRIAEIDNLSKEDLHSQFYCYNEKEDRDVIDLQTVCYSFTYKYLQKEMNIINRCFYEVLNEGDVLGLPFTFPIPTINITEDFDWEDENVDLLFESTAKYGYSYFQNFLGSQYMKDENGNKVRDPNAYSPNDVRSMCCRLQLDKTQLRKKGGGLFGSDSKTGSVGVCTINLPRLGYLYKGNEKSLYKALDKLVEMAKSTLEKKRKVVTELLDRGLYPYTRRYIGSFDTFFSTIGVNGMNECIRNFTNDEHDITDDYGQEFAKKLLMHIREKLVKYQEETGNLYNLEATPAEGTMRRFAHLDKKKYPDILQAGTDEMPFYNNSSQLPVDFTADAFSALDLQDDLQKMYTGGCLAAGSLISTNKGWKKIEDIVNNFNPDDNLEVMSFNEETHEVQWDKVIDAMAIDVSKKDKIRVKARLGLEGGELIDITTSDWHPFYVMTHGENGLEIKTKRADELNPKTDLLIGADGEDSMQPACSFYESRLYTIVSVDKADVEDNQFYDLTTEKNHNYLAKSKWSTGGIFVHNTVLHLYMRERISSAEACKRLVKSVLSNYRLPYISITPTFSICPKHGRLEGEHEYCPLCDRDIINRHAQEVDPNL